MVCARVYLDHSLSPCLQNRKCLKEVHNANSSIALLSLLLLKINYRLINTLDPSGPRMICYKKYISSKNLFQ